MATVTREQLEQYSLVKPDYQKHDPRGLARLYPESITRNKQSFISYNKKMQTFLLNHSLDVATRAANTFGYILVPTSCMHWRRSAEFAERRLLVGRNSFYMMRLEEINDNEYNRLLRLIKKARETA